MVNYLSRLAEWWDSAEKADVIGQGDIVIEDRRNKEGGFDIWPASHRTDPEGRPDRRILHRAPKPKPAWHDAVAVVASTSDFGIRRVFVKDVDGIWNDALSGRGSFEGNLLDVTPLIEQKVTGDMIDRIEHHFISTQGAALPVGFARRLLHIALNLDPA